MKDVYHILEKYQISYQKAEHGAVFSVEQSQKIKTLIKGIGCKNLFLKDHIHYFIVILNDEHQIPLKQIQEQIKSKRLSFGTEEELFKILGLKKGSVSPFGILNDKENKCILVIEKSLKGKTLLFHPNVNTATISISYDDFIKFVTLQNHEYKMINDKM